MECISKKGYKRPEISILLPVYNAEKWIERTVNSVLSQDFSDFELVCIDDGSSDKSADIIERIAQNDCRIKLIKKPNGGVASARQLAMEIMLGRYLFWIDSDDYIDQGCLKALYETAEKNSADVVFVDYIKDMPYKSVRLNQKPGNTFEDCIEKMMSTELQGYIAGKLYRTQYIRENAIRFKRGIDFSEDLIFNLKVLYGCPNIAYLPEAFYHYRFNPDSATTTFSKKYFNQRFLSIKAISEEIKGLIVDKAFIQHKLLIKYGMLVSGCFTEDEYKQIYNIPLKDIRSSSLSFYMKVFLVLAHIGFYSYTHYLIAVLHRIKSLFCRCSHRVINVC